MSQTVRTNRATNPRAASTTGYAAVAGTGGAAALSNQATGGPTNPSVPTFNRVTWSVATTAPSGGCSFTQTGLSASTMMAHMVWVRSSKAQTVALTVQYQTSGAVNDGAAVTGSSVALTANTWTALVVTAISGPSTAQAVLTAAVTSAGVNWAANDTLDLDAILMEAPPVARTNLCTNPSPATSAGWSVNYGGGAGSATFGAVSGLPSANGCTVSFTSAATGAWNVQASRYTGISAGQSVTASLTGTQSWAGGQAGLTMQFFDGSGISLGYFNSGTRATLAANTATMLSYTMTAPANAASVGIFWDAQGGTLPAAGTTAVVGAAIIEIAPAPGTYFDGSTAKTSITLYGWTGASNASTSVAMTTPFTYFDGTFTNAGAVMYAWTGTANASTSTATTYVPAIALTRGSSPCPNVAITLTDLTPTDNVVNVWRTADGIRTPVRGAKGLTVNGSTAFTDYEPPLGRTIAYDLEIVTGATNGAITPTQTTTVTSPLDAAGNPTWWIQDPLVPGSAIALSVNRAGGSPSLTAAAVKALEYASDISIIPVVGSSQPVAIGGQRLIAQNVDFNMVTRTAQATTNLRNLLAQTAVLLIRPPGNRNDGIPGLFYTAVPRPVEQPVTVAFGGTLTKWAIQGSGVAAPTAAILVPIWTYGAVAALWATYQQAQTALAAKTYLDALKSPAGT